jgi:hypothetical protein
MMHLVASELKAKFQRVVVTYTNRCSIGFRQFWGEKIRVKSRESVIGVLSLTVGISLTGTYPAEAASSGFDRCPANYICLFEHADGVGSYIKFYGNDWSSESSPNLHSFDWGDRVSSVHNRTNRTLYAFSDINYEAPCRVSDS